jgi:hypothetical protein
MLDTSAVDWTLSDLRRFLANASRRERWRAALATLRRRTFTNFGDVL